jgi:hypothetical protein
MDAEAIRLEAATMRHQPLAWRQKLAVRAHRVAGRTKSEFRDVTHRTFTTQWAFDWAAMGGALTLTSGPEGDLFG